MPLLLPQQLTTSSTAAADSEQDENATVASIPSEPEANFLLNRFRSNKLPAADGRLKDLWHSVWDHHFHSQINKDGAEQPKEAVLSHNDGGGADVASVKNGKEEEMGNAIPAGAESIFHLSSHQHHSNTPPSTVCSIPVVVPRLQLRRGQCRQGGASSSKV